METHFGIGDLVIYKVRDHFYFGTITYIGPTYYKVDTYEAIIEQDKVMDANMPFKKGSLVKVKEDLVPGTKYGRIYFGAGMLDLRGTIGEVTKVSKNGTYYLENSKGLTLSKEMLEFPINKGDIVTIKSSAFSRYPDLAGNLYKITEMTEDGRILNLNGCGVSVLDVEKVCCAKIESAVKYIGNNKIELKHGDYKEIFDLNELSDENQLQRKDSAVVRGERPEGSRIYGRRPKATISVRPLSHKTCTGFSQGQG